MTVHFTTVLVADYQTCIVWCDIHDRFGTVYLAEDDQYLSMNVNGVVWKKWGKNELPSARRAKWFDVDRVLVWLVHSGAMLMSKDGDQPLELGTPSDIFVSPNYIYVTYSEDAVFSADPDDPEFNVISVYSRTGELMRGLAKLVDGMTHSGILMEATRACIFEDRMFFTAYHTPYIWILDASKSSVRYVTPASDLTNASALSVRNNMIFVLWASGDKQQIEIVDIDSMRVVTTWRDDMPQLKEFMRLNGKLRAQGMPGGKFLLSKDSSAGILEMSISG